LLQMTDLKARMERLDALSIGLAKEVPLIREGNDPLTYLERLAYLEAIQDGIAGLETARVMLAKTVHRIEDGQR
jgi:hypothetical protein